MVGTSPGTRRLARSLLPLALLACTQQPATRTAQPCASDEQCDPGDFCIGGGCTGTSAGAPDAGGGDGGPGGDGGSGAGPDAGADAGVDAGSAPDAGLPDGGAPDAGTVGTGGGAVDLLDFVLTGDTRPPACDATSQYPVETIKAEVAQMAKLPAQFAADLGDHMFSCFLNAGVARAQMDLYAAAVQAYPRPFFMSMGNHECGNDVDCQGAIGDGDPNYQAYKAALLLISHKTLPYYAIDVNTRHGLVRLVFVADNFAGTAASDWLEATLAEADAKAVHTIVLKHHPWAGSRLGPGWNRPILAGHKISLALTAHEHDYNHDWSVLSGRAVICGLGGANPQQTGFCRVQQREDDSLLFTRYDLQGAPLDSWSVTRP